MRNSVLEVLLGSKNHSFSEILNLFAPIEYREQDPPG